MARAEQLSLKDLSDLGTPWGVYAHHTHHAHAHDQRTEPKTRLGIGVGMCRTFFAKGSKVSDPYLFIRLDMYEIEYEPKSAIFNFSEMQKRLGIIGK